VSPRSSFCAPTADAEFAQNPFQRCDLAALIMT
jgi:hypothetical protein